MRLKFKDISDQRINLISKYLSDNGLEFRYRPKLQLIYGGKRISTYPTFFLPACNTVIECFGPLSLDSKDFNIVLDVYRSLYEANNVDMIDLSNRGHSSSGGDIKYLLDSIIQDSI
jgi:hypothetical protein